MNYVPSNQQKPSSKELLSFALSFVRGRATLIVACSVLATALIFVYYPVRGDRAIRFERGERRIAFIVPKSFKTCELKFKNEVAVHSYALGLFVEASGKTKHGGEGRELEQKMRTIVIKNSIPLQEVIRSPNIKSIKIEIKLHAPSRSELLPPELVGVIIDGKREDLETFSEERLLTSYSKYVQRKYVREYVSYFLLLYNDEVSNVLLAILAISLIPVSLPLMDEVRKLSSKGKFENYIKKKYSLSSRLSEKKIQDVKINCGEYFSRKDNYFRFLQVLGPALGFALTISSLIAGLHPWLRETQDVSKFFEAIQVAMVSTFLGLLLRIIAVCRQQINNRLFERADELFVELKKSKKIEEIEMIYGVEE